MLPSPALLVAVALAALLLPLAVAPVPPLLDYPNHLARIWLIAGGADLQPLDSMYRVDWTRASTNIGIDLVAATLGRLTGGLALGPGLVGAAIVLPPLGAVLLNRAVFGGWHWWQVGFAVLAWNATLLAGFLNFQMGLGLAFAAAALDPALVRRMGPVGVNAARVVLGAGVLVVHPFPAGLYGVLIAGLAFGGGWDVAGGVLRPLGQPWFWRRLGRGAGAAAVAAGLPIAALVLLSPTLQGERVPGGSYTGSYDGWHSFLATKLATLLSPITTYDLRVDMAALVALWLAARVLAIKGLFRAHAGLVLAAAGLGALGLLMPPLLGDAALVDWRFPIMALLALVAGVRPEAGSARAGRALALALMAVTMGRTAWVGSVWHTRQADVAALVDVLDLVPAGAAVLPVQHRPSPEGAGPLGRRLANGLATYINLPALGVPLRHAFVPTLFSALGKQPLRVLPPWSEIAVPQGGTGMAEMLGGYERTAATDYVFGYMTNWRARFDFVLVLNADEQSGGGEEAVPGLELLADRGFVRLYRVHR